MHCENQGVFSLCISTLGSLSPFFILSSSSVKMYFPFTICVCELISISFPIYNNLSIYKHNYKYQSCTVSSVCTSTIFASNFNALKISLILRNPAVLAGSLSRTSSPSAYAGEVVSKAGIVNTHSSP